ncbi:MAG: YCF48-related protein, partial [bacterium]
SAKRFFDVCCFDQMAAWTCGMLGEILHTDNGGLDWYAQAIGLSKYATRIEFIDQDHGWATCGDGTVGRTENGGSYWDQIFILGYLDEYYGVSFVNQWDGWIVAGFPDSMLMGQGLILKSTDGGINWDSLYQVVGFEDFFDVHFFNLLDGIVVGGDETDHSPIIMKTSDGGQNWSFITAPASAYYLRAVDFIGSEGWAAGMNGTIIHTTDSGNTWAFQSNPASAALFDIDFSDNMHGLACGHSHLMYTTNGGQNWNDVGVLEEPDNSVIETTELAIYPNPFYKLANISLGKELRAKIIVLRIYDVSGRVIRNLKLPTAYSLLPTSLSWDGTDDAGNKTPPGVYFVRLTASEMTLTKKLVLLR